MNKHLAALKDGIYLHGLAFLPFSIVMSVFLLSGCGLQTRTAAPTSAPASFFVPTPIAEQTPIATAMPTSLPINNDPVSAPTGNDSVQLIDEPKKPDYCNPAEPDTLQEVLDTPASPYFVHHPTSDNPTVPTVIFLAGGSGSQRSAQRAWNNFLSGGSGMEAFRIVVPYSVDVDYIDEAVRTFRVLDEILACYRGDPAKVHLGGASNGGLAAFGLLLARPERFATLLGAPGAFPSRTDPEEWAKALAGHAVFNGVGANDIEWKSEVKSTHDALAAMGVDSVYVEFPGQGHIVNEAFDESVFFDFWAKHSR